MLIGDNYLMQSVQIPFYNIENSLYDIVNAYITAVYCRLCCMPDIREFTDSLALLFIDEDVDTVEQPDSGVELFAICSRGCVTQESFPAMQRNAAAPKDFKGLLSELAVVVVLIDGHPARALLDSGSLSDFMSVKLAHQVGVKVFKLEKALPVQLAVQVSRAKVSLGCNAVLKYQPVEEPHHQPLKL